jgi:hypothetical protein
MMPWYAWVGLAVAILFIVGPAVTAAMLSSRISQREEDR